MGSREIRQRVLRWIARPASHDDRAAPTPQETTTEDNAPLPRESIRVDCAAVGCVTLCIQTPDGAHFDVTLLDVGTGGCSFLLPEEVQPLPDGSALELTFYWGEERRVLQQGILLSRHTRSEQEVGHLHFTSQTGQQLRAMGELVTHVERVHLRVRQNWSPTETENLDGLFSRLDHPGTCTRC
ncbi:MAG: PilZ domain-containing protein [Magnetococcus sp. XQGC-1]